MDSIKKIDFLGEKFELTYHQEKRTKTLLGAGMSLVLICLSFAAVGFFGKEIVLREEPIIRMTEDFSRDNSISLKEVPIMFTLNRESGEFLVGTDFMEAIEISGELTILSYSDEKGLDVKVNTLAFQPCSSEVLSESNFDLLSKEIPLNYFICINPNYYFDPNGNKIEEKLYFQNTFLYRNSTFISIFLSPCDEKANPGCKKPLSVNPTFYVTRYYVTSYFDFGNFNTPLTKFGKSTNNLIDSKMSVRNFTRFTINTLMTDRGFIFKDESSESFFTIEKEYQYFGLSGDGAKIMAHFYHEVSFIKHLHFRRYVKVQEVLANVGGFLKACFLIASLLVKHYSKYTFLTEFSKEVEQHSPSSLQVDSSVIRANNSVSTAVKKHVGLKLSFFDYLQVFWKESRRSRFNFKRYMKHLDLAFISEKLIQLDNTTRNAR